MRKKLVVKQIENPDETKTLETFRSIGAYEMSRLRDDEPSCFNGWVRVKKYKITIELIEEPKEVYAERLNKLWIECDNHHHYEPLISTAKGMGIELDRHAFRKDEKKRTP